MATKISLADWNVMEMLVAVRKLGFLHVIKEVSAFPALVGTLVGGL